MKTFVTTLVLALLVTTTLPCHAESAVPSRYRPQSRSSFSLDGIERNPFWPIGWVKPGKTTPVKTVKRVAVPTLPESAFDVTTILLGELPLAVINGGEYARGDVFSVEIDGAPVKVVVRAIRDGYVALSPEGAPAKITRVEKKIGK